MGDLQAFLELFGANVFDTSFFGARPALEVVFVALHLAGAILAVCALGVAIARIFRFGELIVPVFAVAIVANLGAYMISTHAQDLLGAREMAAVLPLGAVLAGRVLGDRIPAWTRAARAWFVPVLAVLAVGYLAALGYGAAQAAGAGRKRAPGQLAGGARAHATGWPATGRPTARPWTAAAAVLVSAVVPDPAAASCLTCGRPTTRTTTRRGTTRTSSWRTAPPRWPGMQLSAELTFGRPARIYHADGYTILVWNTNLLAKLASSGLSAQSHVQDAAPGHHQQRGHGTQAAIRPR